MPKFKIGKIKMNDGSSDDAIVEFQAEGDVTISHEKEGEVLTLSKEELMTLFYSYVGWEKGVREYKKLTE